MELCVVNRQCGWLWVELCVVNRQCVWLWVELCVVVGDIYVVVDGTVLLVVGDTGCGCGGH